MNTRKQFKEMLQNDTLINAPGAYDVWSAKLIEKAGFNAVYMTGYGSVASELGKPDIGMITMTEMANIAKNIADAISVPLIADADNGYGGLLNVVRTVQEYERNGVACLHLEDQVIPKRCGHMEGKELITKEEMVEKIKAACYARKDPDLTIMARTDARAVNGFDDAIERAKAYIAAGADAIFFEAPQSVEEMKALNEILKVPTLANMVGGGKTPFLTTEELQSIGYNIVIYPVEPLYCATKALMDMLSALKEEGTIAGFKEKMIDFGTFNKMMGLQEYRDLEKSFKM